MTITKEINNIDDYFVKIKSAVEKLFDARNSYLEILNKANGNVSPWFWESKEKGLDEKCLEYIEKHKDKIIIGVSALKEFEAEIFARATLCGAIFQLAYMGIELFSKNENIPYNLSELNKHKKAVEKFCIGREIFNNVPLGLFIFLGRNIYNHYDDSELRDYNRLILKKLPPGEYQYEKFDYIDKLSLVEDLFGNTGMKDYKSFCTELKNCFE